MQEEGVVVGLCLAEACSSRSCLLLFDGFFRGQGIFLLRLSLLELGLVEGGNLRDIGLVRHD